MEKEKRTLTDLQKKLVDIVANKLKVPADTIELDKIKLHKVSSDDYYCVVYNFSGIGYQFPEKEIDEQECVANGIGVWHTYECHI